MNRRDVEPFEHYTQWKKACARSNVLDQLLETTKLISAGKREHAESNITEFFSSISFAVPYEVRGSMEQTIFSAADFIRYGQKVYAIGPELQRMMGRTDLSVIKPEHIRTPIPSFYVALPGCEWKLWGGPTEWHTVGGVYVSMLTKQECWDSQQILVEEHNIVSEIRKDLRFDEPGPGEGGELGAIRILMWGMPNENSSDFGDDAICYMGIFMDDFPDRYSDVEDAVSTRALISVSEAHKKKGWTDPTVLTSDPVTAGQHQATATRCARVVFSLLLYLTGKPEIRIIKPVPRTKSKNPKKQRRDSRRSFSEIRIVGESIERAVYEGRRPAGDRRTSPRRHMVTFHEKIYWCGPGHSRPELRFINPYPRGGKPGDPITSGSSKMSEKP